MPIFCERNGAKHPHLWKAAMKCLLVMWVALVFSVTALAQSSQAADSTPSLTTIQTLIENGRYKRAQEQLDLASALTPKSASLARLRGMIFYKEGLLVDAASAFAQAAELDPNDIEALQMRGVTLYRMGRPGEAIPLLERTQHAKVQEANVDGSYVLGTCYLQIHRYDEARRSFASEYDFGPESPEAYLLLARFLLRHEEVQAALAAVQAILFKAPHLPLAHEVLGEIELAQGKSSEAVVDLETEQHLNPLYPGVYDRLGDAYLRLGNEDKAQQALNRSILLDPTSTGSFIQLGKLYLRQQNASMASMYLQRASSMDPRNIAVHRLLAQAYQRAGDKERAASEIRLAEQFESATPNGAR